MEHILIVDDDQQVLRFASKVLASVGYRVLEASGGDEAVRLCEREEIQIHLLLTDVVMPKFSGYQLAGRLIALQPQLRILLMSGYPNLSGLLNGVVGRSEALQVETDFIPKPFTSSELTSKVRAILDRPAP